MQTHRKQQKPSRSGQCPLHGHIYIYASKPVRIVASAHSLDICTAATMQTCVFINNHNGEQDCTGFQNYVVNTLEFEYQRHLYYMKSERSGPFRWPRKHSQMDCKGTGCRHINNAWPLESRIGTTTRKKYFRLQVFKFTSMRSICDNGRCLIIHADSLGCVFLTLSSPLSVLISQLTSPR